jgi:hypothetical protein
MHQASTVVVMAMVVMAAAEESHSKQARNAEQGEGEQQVQHWVRSSRRDGRGIGLIANYCMHGYAVRQCMHS